MPKLNLRAAKRIKVAAGELAALKGAGFSWTKASPEPEPSEDVKFVQATTNTNFADGDGTSGNTGTLTDVQAGNSLLLVIGIVEEVTGPFPDIAPAITDPAGSSWELLAKAHMDRTGDWGDYTSEVLIYRATNVAAGTHSYSITFDHTSYYACAMIEVTGTPELVTHGFVTWDDYVEGGPLDVSTNDIVPAGETLLIGGAFIVCEWGADNLTSGDGSYTTIGALMHRDFYDALFQYREYTAPGGAVAQWQGSRPSGSEGASRTGYRFVFALQKQGPEPGPGPDPEPEPEPEPAYNYFDEAYAPNFELVEGTTAYAKPSQAKPSKMSGLEEPGYVDSNFGTMVYRVTDVADIPDTVTDLRHIYSRQTVFNADNTLAIVRAENGWIHLYDVVTGAHIQGDRTQTPGYGALDGPRNECEAFWHPTDPKKLWYTGNYGEGMTWYELDVETFSVTVLFDLGPKIHALGGAWTNAARAWFKGEGRPSNDGKRFGLLVQDESFQLIGFIMYDRELDEIIGHQLCSNMPDHCSTSPLGNYIVISWYNGTAEPLADAATRDINNCNGVRAYTADFSSYTQLSALGEHSDLTLDAYGNEVFVSISYRGGPGGQEPDVDDGGIYYRRLDTGVAYSLPGNAYDGSADSSCHISGLSNRGWALISWYGGGSPVAWKDGLIYAVELVPTNQRVLQIAHHHSVYNSYIDEPHAAVSRDFTRIMFASNFGGSTVESYMIGLPTNAVPLAGT